jgi:formylglycine-generating enzyme required for sulfatase activity
MFDKVLRAFSIGDLSFSDLQSSLTRLLKDGAPPDELMGVLRWRESIEPLPEEARDKIVAVLQGAQTPGAPAVATETVEPLVSPVETTQAIGMTATDEEPDGAAMARLIREAAAAWDAEPKARPAAVAAATAVSNGLSVDYKTMRLALGQREDDFAALQAEHSRVLGLLEARARSAAQLQDDVKELAAQLHQSRTALSAQQGKTRGAEEALASLAERDAQIAALRGELARMAPQLESGELLATKLQAELAAAQARIIALEADAASNQARATGVASAAVANEAWADKILALQRALDERNSVIEAQQQQHSKVVASFRARGKAAENELQAARGRIDALASELQTAVRASASSDEGPLAVDGAAPPVNDIPPGVLGLRRGSEIGDFSVPPAAPPAHARIWKPGPVARTAGIGAIIAVLGIVAWVAAHHAPPAARAPEAAPPVLAAGTVIRDCATCPSLTVLPAGRFKQGSADVNSSSSVKPLHWVAIGQPIAMSTNTVTVDQFRAFATATGRDLQGCDTYDGRWKRQPKNSWQNPGFEQAGTHPVTCASWSDATAYAQWLSAQTGHHYRLPSASEWEYAARAGGEAAQPWSANGSDACANANVADLSAARRYPGWVAFACDDGYVFTAPVGSFKANAFGLNDMLGNVFQWTEDCWNASYKGAPLDGSARLDGNCSERELRGGSWFSSPGYVRADYRNHFAANYRTSSAGIRLVRDITP